MILDEESKRVFLLGFEWNCSAARGLEIALSGGHAINYYSKKPLNFDSSIYRDLSVGIRSDGFINIEVCSIPGGIRSWYGRVCNYDLDVIHKSTDVCIHGSCRFGINARYIIDYEFLMRRYSHMLGSLVERISSCQERLGSIYYVRPDDHISEGIIHRAIGCGVLLEEQRPMVYALSRTIACMGFSSDILPIHVAESIQYLVRQ